MKHCFYIKIYLLYHEQYCILSCFKVYLIWQQLQVLGNNRLCVKGLNIVLKYFAADNISFEDQVNCDKFTFHNTKWQRIKQWLPVDLLNFLCNQKKKNKLKMVKQFFCIIRSDSIRKSYKSFNKLDLKYLAIT